MSTLLSAFLSYFRFRLRARPCTWMARKCVAQLTPLWWRVMATLRAPVRSPFGYQNCPLTYRWTMSNLTKSTAGKCPPLPEVSSVDYVTNRRPLKYGNNFIFSYSHFVECENDILLFHFSFFVGVCSVLRRRSRLWSRFVLDFAKDVPPHNRTCS